jgi:hypothetical protein
MRLTPGNLVGPQKCAITQRQKDKRGFIHTNRVIAGMDPEVFISAAAAEELGKTVGMVPEKEVEELKVRVAKLGADLVEALGHLENLQNAENSLRELERV